MIRGAVIIRYVTNLIAVMKLNCNPFSGRPKNLPHGNLSTNHLVRCQPVSYTHLDYPLAPEKRTITDSMVSPYCYRMTFLKDFVCSNGKVEKLITSLKDKTKYLVHYRTLKLYLSLIHILQVLDPSRT